MRYPANLDNNGTIGFTAPSFGCATEPYKTAFVRAQEQFHNRGYSLAFGKNCYLSNGIGISDTPEKCAEDLEEMYLSKNNDVLISCGGGELMCEILPHLDFKKIKNAEPKWFLGYSDNTNFTFLQNTICDTAAIYGSCAAAFGMNPWAESLEDTFAVLTGMKKQFSGYELWEKESLKTEENPTPQYHLTEKKGLIRYVGARKAAQEEELVFEGRLIGGCMDCLVNLTGTQFDYVKEFNERYQKDGLIWFLESCDLNVFAIRRAMWQMEQADWFQYVKGFIIGRPLVFGQEMMGLNQYEAVMGIIGKYHVPVIMDADIGHLSPTVPMVSGSIARVVANQHNWSITYDYR